MKITVSAQTHLNSSDLAKSISFKTFSFEGTLSRFSEKLSNLEDKEITLIGYFLVLNCKQSDFMLSKNKMASCSFYGNSGPETVLGLKFLTKPSFKIDQLRSVNGILHLNQDNSDEYYYRIKKSNWSKFLIRKIIV